MIKAKDTLYCDEITIKTAKNKVTGNTDIVSYTAIGKVKFTFETKDSFFKGEGDKVTFDLKKDLYQIIGNGYLEDKINKKIIHGENIYFDGKNGFTKIDGTKEKPVRFKFTIQSKE
jgi:lipopolysaccharide export system protein LptA